MRTEGIFREAWRDLTSGAAAPVLFGTIFSLMLSGLTLLDLLVVNDLNRDAQEFRDSMASVMVIQSPGHIDGSACESLNSLPGTHAAAVRDVLHPLRADHLPASTIQTYEATSSIGVVLRVEPSIEGVYVSRSLADTLSVKSGDDVRFTSGSAKVGRVFDWDETDGRRAGYSYSAIIPYASDHPFDECWVDVWPMSDGTRAMLQLTILPNHSNVETRIFQMNSTKGETFDGMEKFIGRPTRYAAGLISVLSIGLGYAFVARRRLEVASDFHAGVRRSDLAVKYLVEALSWVGGTWVAMFAVVMGVVNASLSEDRRVLLELSMAYGLVGGVAQWGVRFLECCEFARVNYIVISRYDD